MNFDEEDWSFDDYLVDPTPTPSYCPADTSSPQQGGPYGWQQSDGLHDTSADQYPADTALPQGQITTTYRPSDAEEYDAHPPYPHEVFDDGLPSTDAEHYPGYERQDRTLDGYQNSYGNQYSTFGGFQPPQGEAYGGFPQSYTGQCTSQLYDGRSVPTNRLDNLSAIDQEVTSMHFTDNSVVADDSHELSGPSSSAMSTGYDRNPLTEKRYGQLTLPMYSVQSEMDKYRDILYREGRRPGNACSAIPIRFEASIARDGDTTAVPSPDLYTIITPRPFRQNSNPLTRVDLETVGRDEFNTLQSNLQSQSKKSISVISGSTCVFHKLDFKRDAATGRRQFLPSLPVPDRSKETRRRRNQIRSPSKPG